MNSDKDSLFVSAARLALAAGVHVDMIKRRIYEKALFPDAWLEWGEDRRVPIFLAARVQEHARFLDGSRKISLPVATEVVR